LIVSTVFWIQCTSLASEEVSCGKTNGGLPFKNRGRITWQSINPGEVPWGTSTLNDPWMLENPIATQTTFRFLPQEASDDTLDVLRQTLWNLEVTATNLDEEFPMVWIIERISGN